MDLVDFDTNRYYDKLDRDHATVEQIEKAAAWLISHEAYGEIAEMLWENGSGSLLVAAVMKGKLADAMAIIENAAYQYAEIDYTDEGF